MISSIDNLLEETYNYDSSESSSDDDSDNIAIITDFTKPLEKRIQSLNEYYLSEGDKALEVLFTLSGMYQMSGSKIIEQFFSAVCFESKVSSFLKLEAAKSILEYKELEEGSSEDEEEEEEEMKERIKRNKNVRQRNYLRESIGYKALNKVCSNLEDMPTPCRVDAILKLMNSEEFNINSVKYFNDFVCDQKIECDFRYKTILSLENIGATLMKERIIELFDDKKFVENVYETLESVISKLFPNVKFTVYNFSFWEKVFFQISYDDIRNIYKKKFSETSFYIDSFIREAQLGFLFYKPNRTLYRALSGQYLLQKCDLSETLIDKVENEILFIAKDEQLDYNIRADAADVLLSLGSVNMKKYGRDIIIMLGKIDGTNFTIFDNAQNVHTQKVEESVSEALEFLNALPIYKVKNKSVDFEYIRNHILNILKERKKVLYKSKKGQFICDYCESKTSELIKFDKNKLCSNECLVLLQKDQKINISLNRIFMDRVLYSNFNNTLSAVVVMIYTYIMNKEDESVKEQMITRLLEELEDMCGICSSGIIARLINVMSGFGNFSIRISYEDQIVSSFTGRLNKAVMDIASSHSIFRKEKLYDVISLWLNNEENSIIKTDIENKLSGKNYSMKDIIDDFLKDNREDKIEICIECFSDAVLDELTLSRHGYGKRRNFSLFFRCYVSTIREEFASEFKDLLSSSEFDFAFRKALIVYDGDS